MSQPNSEKKHFYLIVLGALALGLFLGRMSYLWSDSIPMIYRRTSSYKILALIRLINQKYVDKVNTDSIVNVVLTDVLGELDPHSVYFTKSQYRSVNYEVQGHYKGIGISFNKNFLDTPIIIRVMPHSPAMAAGIIPGDMIIKLNGDSTVKYSTDQLTNIIAGASKVKLEIKRYSIDTQFTVSLKKKEIELPTVYGYMLPDSLCFVKITSFGKNTYNEFMSVTKKCQGRIKGMILDLRDNGGGMLGASTDILDEFFPKKTLMFYLKDKQKVKERFYANKNGAFENIPLVVLINKHTASASELIAGAIQDNDRGVIVGSRSFGKGLVQSEYHFPDGSVVRLTTAKYYTPSGRCLQRPYSTYYYLLNGDANDSLKIDSAETFHTKDGRVIYGGGGVFPDVWVSDTLETNTLSGLLMALKILRLWGEQIHNVNNIADLESFIDSTLDVKVDFDDFFSLEYNLLESRFPPDSAYRYFNFYSPVYHKALEIIENKQEYKRILSKPADKDD